MCLKKNLLGGGKYEMVQYIEVEYIENVYKSLVDTVRVFVFGNGLLLLGSRVDVASLVDIVRIADVDLFRGVYVDVLSVSIDVCRRVDAMIKSVGDIHVFFHELGRDKSVMLSRGGKYRDYVLSLVNRVDVGMVSEAYVLSVEKADIQYLSELVKRLMPGLVFSESTSGFVVQSYLDYRNLQGLLRKLDVLERQLFVQLYLLDIQDRGTKNLGADVVFNNGQFSYQSSLRDSVGLGMFGSYRDFSVYLNYLVTKFDGKVVTSPSMVMCNKSVSSMNFGQRIPTLKSKAANDSAEIIQNVEYVDVGLGVTLKPRVSGEYVYIDLNIFNSSVLENVGVEGNPQFANDSMSVSMVTKLGGVSVVGGLKRKALESNRSFTLFPNKYFRKNESREFLICVRVDEVGVLDCSETLFAKMQLLVCDK